MQKHYCLTALTPLQTKQITELINHCRQAEALHLGFPEDGDLFLFTGEENNQNCILSCLIVCKVQPTLWECYAFTRPDCRKQGLFSYLLAELCRRTPEDTELIFLIDHQSPDALAAAQAKEMELLQTEYQMEQTLTPSAHCRFRLPAAFSLQSERITENGENQQLFSAFLTPDSTAPNTVFLGSCRILAYDDLRVYLHHMEIAEAFRSQGWGTLLIHAVLSQLPENTSIRLQVSSENTAAVKLYKKTGFHVTETLSYYFY